MVKVSRYLHVGPGGMNCTCCFPAPRSKDRRKQWRSAKRKADHEAMRNALADLVDDHWMELEETAAEYEKAYGPYGSPFDDPWENYDYYEDLRMEEDLLLQEEDYYCNDSWDDYGDSYDDYGDDYYHQSEQEKVARAMCLSLLGSDRLWREYLNNAKTFMEVMRNGS